jgi:hypothetical protein
MNLDDLSIVFFINDIYHLNMPGNVLLFRVLRQSTISAEGLNFRVRNGIGCNTFAIITRHEISILLKADCKPRKYNVWV